MGLELTARGVELTVGLLKLVGHVLTILLRLLLQLVRRFVMMDL